MSDQSTFWARRRAAVEAEAKADARAQDIQERHELDAQLSEKTDEDLLAELNLPDPDTLKIGDDFSAFMSKAVPDRLRRRALRVLWRSNPVLANVDALVDYGQDFTDSAMVVENMQTAYQVGKGMLAHIEKMAAEAEAKEAAAQAADAPDTESLSQQDNTTEDDDTPFVAARTRTHEADWTPADTMEVEGEADTASPPSPRRMAFSFETHRA